MDPSMSYSDSSDYTDNEAIEVTWIIVGTAAGLLFIMGLGVAVCLIWQRHSAVIKSKFVVFPCCAKCIRNPRDSLTSLEEEIAATSSYRARVMRKGKATVLGVKLDRGPIAQSAASGYRWKKKWRDRKARSRERRRVKHQERKKRRAEREAEVQMKEEDTAATEASSASSESDEESSEDDTAEGD